MANKNKAITLRTNRRELATILAALRYYQDENLQGGRGIPDQFIRQIATDGDALKPLDFQEVGRLCERLNTGGGRRTSKGLSVGPPPQDGGKEPIFRAVYVIDVHAVDPIAAAGCAHRLMIDPDSQPPVLEVIDAGGNVTTTDLSEEDEAPSAPAAAPPAIRRGSGYPPAPRSAGLPGRRGPDASNDGGHHVILSVSGGVPDLVFKPAGITITIFDYDIEGEEDTDKDPGGEACRVGEWPVADVVHENMHWPLVRKAIRGGQPYTRRWKCPGCDRTVECSYEDLAEAGSPFCSECDEEMTLL